MQNIQEKNARFARRMAWGIALAAHLGLGAAFYFHTANDSSQNGTSTTSSSVVAKAVQSSVVSTKTPTAPIKSQTDAKKRRLP